MWEKITDELALSLKPKNLPEVEKELKIPPPRPMVWICPESAYKKITDEIKKLLIYGIAARAWKTSYKTTSDREGTDHFVQYCFKAGGKLFHGKNIRSFDDLHLAYGSPDYASWITNAYKHTGTFTVIYEKDNPVNHEIYGHLELYIKEDLLGLSEKMRSNSGPNNINELSSQFLKIAVGPIKSIGDNLERYLNLMKELGLAGDKGIHDSDRNLKIIKNIIPSGNYNSRVLEELSLLCSKYIPGIWAAE